MGTNDDIVLCVVCFQVVCIGAQDEEEKTECVPGFQEKEYHVEYNGGFLRDVPLLQGTAMMSSAILPFSLSLSVCEPHMCTPAGERTVPRGFGEF